MHAEDSKWFCSAAFCLPADGHLRFIPLRCQQSAGTPCVAAAHMGCLHAHDVAKDISQPFPHQHNDAGHFCWAVGLAG